METCTEEVGLLRKKPCGKAMVTHCGNCEQPLCSDHAVPQLTETGKKSGKFMCKACHEARKEFAKTLAAQAKDTTGPLKKDAPAARPAAPPAAPKPAPAAAKPQPAAAAAEKKEEKPFKPEDTGPLEFTPTKKP
jgi:hypothetical protein